MSAHVFIRFTCDICRRAVESTDAKLPDGWRVLDRLLGRHQCADHPAPQPT